MVLVYRQLIFWVAVCIQLALIKKGSFVKLPAKYLGSRMASEILIAGGKIK